MPTESGFCFRVILALAGACSNIASTLALIMDVILLSVSGVAGAVWFSSPSIAICANSVIYLSINSIGSSSVICFSSRMISPVLSVGPILSATSG